MTENSPLVGAPLGPIMFKLAVPGVIGALIFSSLSMLEAYFLKDAGNDALAAVAVVYPLLMLAAMLSAGAIGGSISGHTARAMGAGDTREASAVLCCAVLISLVGGLIMWLLVLFIGPLLYAHATESARIASSAQQYAAIVFPAMPVYWLLNMLCSFMRGTGDMLRPAIVATVMIVSYAFFAIILIPDDDTNLDATIRGGALSMVAAFFSALVVTIYFIVRSDQSIRLSLDFYRWAILLGILRQGLLAGSQSAMTICYAMVTTILLGRYGTEWLAGFGLAVRLELIMVPVIFGMGASLIAIVGAYVGSGQRQRAITIAWQGIIINAAVVGVVGILFSLFPGVWCGFLGSDASVIANCSQSVRLISPTYAFFALGLGGYFASQGLDTLSIPVMGALLRLLIVATGLWWVSSATDITLVLGLIAIAIVSYGLFVAIGLKIGPWRQSGGVNSRR